MKALLIATIFVFCNLASAYPKVTVKGTLMSFDEKVITIQQASGAKVKAPRSSLPKIQGLTAGKSQVTLRMNPSDFVTLNPKAVRK